MLFPLWDAQLREMGFERPLLATRGMSSVRIVAGRFTILISRRRQITATRLTSALSIARLLLCSDFVRHGTNLWQPTNHPPNYGAPAAFSLGRARFLSRNLSLEILLLMRKLLHWTSDILMEV